MKEMNGPVIENSSQDPLLVDGKWRSTTGVMYRRGRGDFQAEE